MRLTVVGAAAAWTRRPGHASSCYLVEADGAAIVLDMGQGAFAALAAHREPTDLAGVLVSHPHPDHLVDLVPLRHALRYEDGPDTIPAHLPPTVRERLCALMGEPDFLDPLPGEDLADGRTLRIGPFEVLPRTVSHVAHSFGFRVSRADAPDLPGLAYSGDCGLPADVARLCRPGDVLLCEASWGAVDEPVAPIHLTAAQAGEAAREAGASRLLVTHVGDGHDREAVLRAARETFEGEVAVVAPGLVFAIDAVDP